MSFFIIVENPIVEKLMTQKRGRSKTELYNNVFCHHTHTHKFSYTLHTVIWCCEFCCIAPHSLKRFIAKGQVINVAELQSAHRQSGDRRAGSQSIIKSEHASLCYYYSYYISLYFHHANACRDLIFIGCLNSYQQVFPKMSLH